MSEDLKVKLINYCKTIEIKYLSKLSLNKSANGLEYPMYLNDHTKSLKNKEEILFIMFYLYTKGFYYSNTLNLTDAIIYEKSLLTDLYKKICYLICKKSDYICYDSSQFFVNFSEFSENEFCSENNFTKITNLLFKLLHSDQNIKEILKDLLKLIQNLLKKEFNKIESGFSYSNSLHFNTNIIITPLKIPLIKDILENLQKEILFSLEILESNNLFNYLLYKSSDLSNFNIIFKILFFNYFKESHYKYFFTDFMVLKENLTKGKNIKSTLELVLYFFTFLKEKKMIDEKKHFFLFLKKYFYDGKRKLDEFSVTDCYWTNEMYKIFKLN